LRKIIEREDNWSDTFKRIFSRRDILISTLGELEFIRNKIAHNRKATSKDVEIVEGAYSKLSASIGESYFRELSIRCTCSKEISERLSALQKECESTFCLCNDCKQLAELDAWKSISAEWWFDESYLGCKLEAIADYFGTVDTYLALPRSRGSGHRIESWVKSSGIKEKFANAQSEFTAILSCGGKKSGSK
jgi:hypothetical protein